MSILFVFLLLGLAVGSFLNVLIIRLRDAETLLGRSFCRNCSHKIRWYDNIPLASFAVLRGACRDCGERISWQYPLVEGITALVFLLIGIFFFSFSDPGSWLVTAWLLGLSSVLIALAAYDAKYLEIPVSMLLAGIAWTAAYLLADYFLFGSGIPFWETSLALGIAGGAVVTAFFFSLVWFSKETWMGWGDVWLGLLAGMAIGLPRVFFMLTLSFALGAIVGVALLSFSKKSLKTEIPFGPFLAFGIFCTLFLSQAVPSVGKFFLW